MAPNNLNKDPLESLKLRLRAFAADRDWDKFHSPKNLSMALIAEAGELIEHFQWISESESCKLSPEKLKEVELELGDILIYLIRLADKLEINLLEAANSKLEVNKRKYPSDKVRGSAKKYNEY